MDVEMYWWMDSVSALCMSIALNTRELERLKARFMAETFHFTRKRLTDKPLTTERKVKHDV